MTLPELYLFQSSISPFAPSHQHDFYGVSPSGSPHLPYRVYTMYILVTFNAVYPVLKGQAQNLALLCYCTMRQF